MLKIVKELFFLGVFSFFVFESSALNVTSCAKIISETVCDDSAKGLCLELTKKSLTECLDTDINKASKVFEWVSIATSGVSFVRWIAAKCFRPYRFVTVRNKFVRFLSKEEVSQSINLAATVIAAVSLSRALDDYDWWFWTSKVIESLPLIDLVPCLISDLLYLLPHDRDEENDSIRTYLRAEGAYYNGLANDVQ